MDFILFCTIILAFILLVDSLMSEKDTSFLSRTWTKVKGWFNL